MEDKITKKKKIVVKYDKVLKEGITRMIVKKPVSKKILPEKHKLGQPEELYELTTTAEVEGKIEVAIDFSDIKYEGSAKKLKMLHKTKDGEWIDITKEILLEEKVILGQTDSFSDFGIFEVDVIGLINKLTNEVLLLNLQQGILNSLDAKLNAVINAMDDFNANNDIAAINTLEAFIAAVQAQSGNKISVKDADVLTESAKEVITALSNP